MSGPLEPTEADLAVCATEPIHIPGAIQPHGVLLGVDPSTRAVVRVSANAEGLLGRTAAECLGAPLDELVPGAWESGLGAEELSEVNPMVLGLPSGASVEAVASRAGDLLLLELEPVVPGDEGFDTSYLRIRALLHRLQGARSLEDLAAATATEVRALTGFGRVMVYRFDAEWNGEVIAEARRADLEPFLGLWYPASDIPAQARALYAATWLRLIADVDYSPTPILPSATGTGGEPLDLGGSVLRSVSPVHLQYLRNMGVAASMSISLKHGDRLWGLVACHQQERPHRPPYRVRAVAELVGQLVSVLLPGVEEAGSLERALADNAVRSAVADALAPGGRDPVSVLAEVGDDLLALTGATGALVRLGGREVSVGTVPPADAVRAVWSLLGQGAGSAVAVDCLSDVEPSLAEVKDVAAGALVVPVGAGGDQFVAWFRPEVLREISWGGDRREKVVVDEGRIGPRTSFAEWTETVRLHARPWEPGDIEGASWLGRHLADVVVRELQARAEVVGTVQRALLLEAVPEVPGLELALRHRPGGGDALGGDWHDVFWLPGGRIAVTVGDVAGHGLGAAPAMAQLRHGLRAYLLNEAAPGDALRRLNELVGLLLPDDMASVVVADLDPATGRLLVANAGHLPPVLVGAGAARLLDDVRGPALGVLDDPVYAHESIVLAPGDTLLLYSDGLVEVRGESLDVGLDRLRQGARDIAGSLDAVAAELLARAPEGDDVTLLAVRRR